MELLNAAMETDLSQFVLSGVTLDTREWVRKTQCAKLIELLPNNRLHAEVNISYTICYNRQSIFLSKHM